MEKLNTRTTWFISLHDTIIILSRGRMFGDNTTAVRWDTTTHVASSESIFTTTTEAILIFIYCLKDTLEGWPTDW
jgi:hypothetical protein